MNQAEVLDKVIGIVGSMQRLADFLGITKAAVFQWKKRQIPAEHCPRIERATGALVTCEELRPDIDWAYIRNTKHRSKPKK